MESKEFNFDIDDNSTIEDLEMIDFDLNSFFRELTPEEKEKRKKEEAISLATKGFLPKNESFDGGDMGSPQEIVELEPRKYIIEECIPACQELWKKNIYTFMVSDHLNEGVCWIEIDLDSLSDENKEIYAGLSEEEAIKFSYHSGCVNFGVNSVGKEGQSKLLELAKKFKMQDVPLYSAYISPEMFLVKYCGCYEEYENSEYKEMVYPFEMKFSNDYEYLEYINRYREWEASNKSMKTLKRFDPTKVKKDISEYAKEHGMIYDEGRIYLSKFHYDKHKKYVEYEKNMNTQNIESTHKRY